MSVKDYTISLLSHDKCRIQFTPDQLVSYLKAWRKKNSFGTTCAQCQQKLDFGPIHFTICCDKFYYNGQLDPYPVESIAIATPGYQFVLPQLKKMLNDESDQDFLVVPDPIYWQMKSTLVYEKTMKFVMGKPMTNRTTQVQPKEKSGQFYKQIQEAPLNYGSLSHRSCGKATLIRQIAFGKRCQYSMRATITPDTSLRPNEIALPRQVVEKFNLLGKWVLVNRMPSLQPENVIALKVVKIADFDNCVGIPMEIVAALKADFDGDEFNIYILMNVQSQAECEQILNSENVMGSVNMGLVLSPSQDMLVAYRLWKNEIDFLPSSSDNDLKTVLRILYDIHGSKRAFEGFDKMRQFYLRKMFEDCVFGLTLEEMLKLVDLANNVSLEQFEKLVKSLDMCLVHQIEAGAKGSYDLLYQMFGSIDLQNGKESSFWKGLTPNEAVTHAMASIDSLSQLEKIWEPGYSYSKSVYNLQGLNVNYLGQLVDGRTVVENDALDALHHTDILSESAFVELMKQEFT